MRWSLLAFGLAPLLASAALAFADEEEHPDGEFHNIIFLEGTGPKIVRLHIQIDGQGVGAIRQAYAEQLFRSLDAEKDGSLDEQEAVRIPQLAAGVTVQGMLGPRWNQVDRSERDGRVSLEELAVYIGESLGATVEIVPKPQRNTQRIPLFDTLDGNGDGHLARDEFDRAATLLRKYDLDDDETFSVVELQPFGTAAAQAESQQEGIAANAFLLIDSSNVSTRALEILQRYSHGQLPNPGSPWPSLDSDAVRFTPEQMARLDLDSSSTLDQDELAGWLSDHEPDVRLLVQLPFRQRGRPRCSVLPGDAPAAAAGQGVFAESVDDNRLRLSLGETQLDWRAQGTIATASDSVNFYKLQFRIADGDKNKYLDEGEFAALNLPNAVFSAVDLDGDGMVFEQEVVGFVQRDAAVSQSRIVISVGKDGKSLFEVLDINLDLRLSRREMAEGYDRVLAFDANRDGRLAATELDGRYELTVEIGKPALFQNAMGPAGEMTAPTSPRIPQASAGPVWYQRMDRNRDGDVSEREFPGPLELFRRLDADGNRLIDAEEAANAGRD